MAVCDLNSIPVIRDIVICKSCQKPEYWGEMRWLHAKCVCRDCYKRAYEKEYSEPYKWDDLEGERPTMADYRAQEGTENA